jgi:type IV pilus assembly protein PilM
MSLFRRNKSKKVLSLDIGSDAIKMLVTTGSFPDSFEIVDYRYLQINASGKGVQLSEIPAILSAAVPELRVPTQEIRACIPGNAVIIRVIETQEVSRHDLKKAVALQLGRYIPMKPEDVVFDCTPINDTSVRAGYQKCLLAVIRRNVLEERSAILKTAGLTPLLIDAESVAVMNAYLGCAQDFDREQGISRIEGAAGACLLHIGASHADLLVLKGTVPLVCRTIETGADSMVKAIADTLQSPYAEAVEHLKHLKDQDDSAAQHIHKFVDVLSREIRTSLEYCSREYDLKTERIYVTGAAANNELVCQNLADTLSFSTYCFNPFVNVKVEKLRERIGDFRSKAPAFAPALGLAIRHLKV